MKDHRSTDYIERDSYGLLVAPVMNGGWKATMRNGRTRILSNAKRLCGWPRVGQEIIVLHGPAKMKGKWKLSLAEENRNR